MFRLIKNLSFVFLFIAVLQATTQNTIAQSFDRIERGRTLDMLKNIKNEIKKNYYDEEFHGVNLDERFSQAEEKLKQASSLGQAFGIIAQAVMDLNDSHTVFIPPARNIKVEYGWQMQMIGDKPYIVAVKPKSDAEAKGLKPGDEIISVDGFHPNRKEMWKMLYYYYSLSPRSGMKLVVQSPGEQTPRQLEVASKVTQLKRTIDLTKDIGINDFLRDLEDEGRNKYHRFQKVGGATIWKMPGFDFAPDQVDSIMENRVAGSTALVLDLRGNPGGYIATLEELVGYLFKSDQKIADLKGRKEMKPMQSNVKSSKSFNGKLVILIDSGSGSCSEILARLVQLEKRGVVIGDNSIGAVMQSRSFSQQMGTDKIVLYGVNITNADVIMSDGKSLEHVGVVPDEFLLPTAEDLAAGRDPVLAHALELVGSPITPEQAGKFFPVEWEN